MLAPAFTLDRARPETLRSQLGRQVLAAIAGGQLRPGTRLPSTRRLAGQLGLARNTVAAAYSDLASAGHLVASPRSGYLVGPDSAPTTAERGRAPGARPARFDWDERLAIALPRRPSLLPPGNWRQLPFPFVYGQLDHTLFPLAPWRDCARRALARAGARPADATGLGDHPELVEQIRATILPRRGIHAGPDEIAITLGTQQALFLLAFLLVRRSTTVGIEDPGYGDAHGIFGIHSRDVRPLAVDDEGLVVDERLAACDLLYVTPAHQMPTTVTMSEGRRMALLARAAADDIVVIEDDYDADTSFGGELPPALKALDCDGRVIHVGTFSKSIAPGLRIGFVVGPPTLMAELRALRRMILRDPPAENQIALALFLAGGHYDVLIRRLNEVYLRRWETLCAALDAYLPAWTRAEARGGVCLWSTAPPPLDTTALAAAALARGVIVDPGEPRYARPRPPRNHLRFGLSVIPAERIEPGIRILADVAAGHRAGRPRT